MCSITRSPFKVNIGTPPPDQQEQAYTDTQILALMVNHIALFSTSYAQLSLESERKQAFMLPGRECMPGRRTLQDVAAGLAQRVWISELPSGDWLRQLPPLLCTCVMSTVVRSEADVQGLRLLIRSSMRMFDIVHLHQVHLYGSAVHVQCMHACMDSTCNAQVLSQSACDVHVMFT